MRDVHLHLVLALLVPLGLTRLGSRPAAVHAARERRNR
jgi:hypothetical protein